MSQWSQCLGCAVSRGGREGVMWSPARDNTSEDFWARTNEETPILEAALKYLVDIFEIASNTIFAPSTFRDVSDSSCDLVTLVRDRETEDEERMAVWEGLGEAGQAQSLGTAPTGIMCHLCDGQCPLSQVSATSGLRWPCDLCSGPSLVSNQCQRIGEKKD